MEDIGFRIRMHKQKSARQRVWLAKALREQTIDANLDAKHIKHKH